MGLRIRQLRREVGCSFDAFVEEVGLGRGYVSELERGLVIPSLSALRRVAAVLAVTPADLVLEGSAREQLYEATRRLPGAAVLLLLSEAQALRPPEPRQELRFVPKARARSDASALPLLALNATAGGWGRPGAAEPVGYVRVVLRTESKRGLFVAQVTGRSMEPTIPEGAYALFSRPWLSPLRGEAGLFAQWDGDECRFTVKEYEPVARDGQVSGRLRSRNPAVPSVRAVDAERAEPFARFVRVVG